MANRNYTMKEKTASGYDVLLPKTTAAQVVTDANNRFVTDNEKATWNAKPSVNDQQVALDTIYQQATGYTDIKIAKLLGGAPPAALDTIFELAEAIVNNKDVITALNEAIAKKAAQAEFEAHDGNNTIHVTQSDKNTWNKPTYTEATTLAELTSGESVLTAWGKTKLAVKNVINIIKLLGSTDISAIGSGTVTDILSLLNSRYTELNSSLGGVSPITHTFIAYTYAVVQGSYALFSMIPLLRADLYNISFTIMHHTGIGNDYFFDSSRFAMTKNRNGILMSSTDVDIRHIIGSYPGIYSFTITATVK